MSREFKHGERVFSILEGWGSIIEFKKRVMHPENDMRPAHVIVRFDKDDNDILLNEYAFDLLQNEEYTMVPIAKNKEHQLDQDGFKDDPDRHFLMYTSAELIERLINQGVTVRGGVNSTANLAVQVCIEIIERVDEYLNSKKSGENN